MDSSSMCAKWGVIMENKFVIVRFTRFEIRNNKLILIRSHVRSISEIDGLDKSEIKSLNLSGNQITEITGLDALTTLHELKLGNNKITEIKGLDALTNLEALDLSDNQITEIKGLDALTNLHELNLVNNCHTIQFSA